MTFHSLSSVASRHPLHGIEEFADTTARDAYTYTDNDVGKVVKVVSPLGYFLILSQSGGTATFAELGTTGTASTKVYLDVRNETGSPLTTLQVVYVSGFNGSENRPLVSLADKDDAAKRPAVGVIETTIADSSNGQVLIAGPLTGVNTSAWNLTDQLVLGANGALSRPPPDQDPFTGEVQDIASVTRVDASNGSIMVAIGGLHTVTASQVFALAGTDGTPSKTNPYVTDSDPRLDTQDIFTAWKEPSGFLNRTDSTISRIDGTRTFTIQPAVTSYDVFFKGVLVTKSSPENVVWPDTEGVHWFYFDNSYVLQTTTDDSLVGSIISGDGNLVAALAWDATNKISIMLFEERHGLMPGPVHAWAHRNIHAVWTSGGLLANFTVDGNGSLDAHAQFSVGSVKFADEDISYDIQSGSPQTLSPIAQIPIIYRLGPTGNWRFVNPDNFPLIYGGKGFGIAGDRIPYNQYTGATWQLTEVANLRFIVMLYFATNNVDWPIVAVQGQNEYATLNAARTGAFVEAQNLVTGELEGLLAEVIPLGAVIYQSSDTYSNTPKAIVRSTGEGDYVDIRPKLSGNSTGVAVSVASVFGRTGNVTAQASDYDASQVDDDSTFASASVAAALTTTKSHIDSTSNPHGTDIGNLGAGTLAELNSAISDATLGTLTATAPVDVTKATAAVGTSAEVARQDHKHDVSTAAPSTIGTANTEGTATSLARSDHVHNHGAQTDGSLHAAATTSVNGFMSSGDKTKLDGIATGAAALTATAPADVTKAAAAVGVATDAARADHKHDITTAAATSVGASNTEGSATTLARSDHTHAVTNLAIASEAQGDVLYRNATVWTRLPAGTSGQFLQTQGVAANPQWASATALTATAPVDVTKAAAAVGVATDAARADHKHDISTAAASALTGASTSTEGTATSLARSDHTHSISGILSGTAPVNVTKAAAAAGTATSAARQDHKHDVTTAAAVAVGTANAEGTSTSLSRADHTHQVTGLTISGQVQGDILYRNATSWVRLPAGTSGQYLQTLGAAANPQWASAGDVVGPASSVDNTIVRFNSTTGKLIQGGTNAPTYDDSGNIEINTNGSSAAAPRRLSFVNFSTGEAYRWDCTGNDGIQSEFGGSLTYYSYNSMVFRGNRNTTGAPTFDADAGVSYRFESGQAGQVNFVVRGADSQTAALQQWVNNPTSNTVLVEIQADGDIDHHNHDVLNVKTATNNGVVAHGSMGTTETIDWSAGMKHSGTNSANCVLTFTAPPGPANLLLILTNGGAFTLSWPASVLWPGGSPPTWTASGVDLVAFVYDGTNYYGFASKNFS